MWCRVNCWELECLTFWSLLAIQYLLSRRFSRSLQEPRGGVHLLNSWRLDQCHMWHFQMPAAGAANGSHNGIATINRLSREMFCKKRKELKLNGFESHPFLSKCVDITILTYYDYHHTAKVIQKINSQAVFTLFWQYCMQYLMRSTFIRASGGGRLWWHQHLIKCGVVPSTSLWLLLDP